MSGTILSTLFFNQRLNKLQKAKVIDSFQYNIDSFNDFLERSDYWENEDKLKKMFPFDDEMMWDNVLKNYKSNNSTVSRLIADRMWDGYTFDEDDDNKWGDVFIDLFLDDWDGDDSKTADIYYDWLIRWYNQGKILWDVNTSVWVEVIRRMHGRSYGYLGEIIFYLMYNDFDESEKADINEILGYDEEIYDDENDRWTDEFKIIDFVDYVDNHFGGIKEFADSMS